MNKKTIIVVVFLVVISYLGYGLYSSKYLIQNSYYTITSGLLTESIRIIQLTDLHNSEFGTKNQRLIDQVTAQEPDLILLTGDLVNSNEKDTETAVTLIKGLSGIAPVYISLGNHEKEYEEIFNVDIIPLLEEAGAKVLEFFFEDVIINEQTIRIGGAYGYLMPARYLELDEADPEECSFLEAFQDTDLYTILLCHMPCCWLINDGINEWNVDCVFSGHVHGGEVIFPFVGGLYAPDFGWFPGKLQGLYHSDDEKKTLVLSRGLGTSEVIPRFNNVPEVVVVDLLPR